MSELPVWAAILISALAIIGSFLTLVGCIGLAHFRSFYDRVHAPTLGTSFGTVGVVVSSIIYFSMTHDRPVLHEILILVFVTLTTPVTLMLLARAALYRDRAERNPGVPQAVDDNPGEVIEPQHAP
jgi:multicomponent K+:H+ antiporter subunit G